MNQASAEFDALYYFSLFRLYYLQKHIKIMIKLKIYILLQSNPSPPPLPKLKKKKETKNDVILEYPKAITLVFAVSLPLTEHCVIA
jgi:hypothetical protein